MGKSWQKAGKKLVFFTLCYALWVSAGTYDPFEQAKGWQKAGKKLARSWFLSVSRHVTQAFSETGTP